MSNPIASPRVSCVLAPASPEWLFALTLALQTLAQVVGQRMLCPHEPIQKRNTHKNIAVA